MYCVPLSYELLSDRLVLPENGFQQHSVNLMADHEHLNRIFQEWDRFQQMITIFVVSSDYHHHFGLCFVNNEFYFQLLILQLFSARLPSLMHTKPN